MKIGIAAESWRELKEIIHAFLLKMEYEVVDFWRI